MRSAIPTLLLALLRPGLGMTQPTLLVGRWHWVVRVVHLGIGLAALRMAEELANTMRRRVASWLPFGGSSSARP